MVVCARMRRQRRPGVLVIEKEKRFSFAEKEVRLLLLIKSSAKIDLFP